MRDTSIRTDRPAPNDGRSTISQVPGQRPEATSAAEGLQRDVVDRRAEEREAPRLARHRQRVRRTDGGEGGRYIEDGEKAAGALALRRVPRLPRQAAAAVALGVDAGRSDRGRS